MTNKSQIPALGETVDHDGYNCLKCGVRLARRTKVGEETEEGRKHKARLIPSICLNCLNLAIYDFDLGILREPSPEESLFLKLEPGWAKLIEETREGIRQTWKLLETLNEE